MSIIARVRIYLLQRRLTRHLAIAERLHDELESIAKREALR